MVYNPTLLFAWGPHYHIFWWALTWTNILALDLGLDMKGHKGHWLVGNLLGYWWTKSRIFDSHAAGFTPYLM